MTWDDATEQEKKFVELIKKVPLSKYDELFQRLEPVLSKEQLAELGAILLGL